MIIHTFTHQVLIVVGAIASAWGFAGSCVELLGFELAQDHEVDALRPTIVIVYVAIWFPNKWTPFLF